MPDRKPLTPEPLSTRSLEIIRTLENGLDELARASAQLRPFIGEEHLDAIDKAWDAGTAVLARVVAYGMPIEEAS